jgi:hypothetical protein
MSGLDLRLMPLPDGLNPCSGPSSRGLPADYRLAERMSDPFADAANLISSSSMDMAARP